jgi:Domain of unknown function (DUF4180)
MTRTLEVDAEGPALRGERDAVTLIGDALSVQADVVVVPISRFADEFFNLETRVAGDMVQKFVNYGIRLAIVGDISARTAQSKSLHDFVYESNRGNRIWFVASKDELNARLARDAK